MNRRSAFGIERRHDADRSNRIKPLIEFLRTEAAGGVVVAVAALVALVWANSPWSASYMSLWKTAFPIQIGALRLNLDLKHWVNDALMTLFFFLAGLEIKREVLEGELRDKRKAIVPVAAALGGMVIPALVFVAITRGSAFANGWGIPMATDIALAVGVVSLVGRRVPSGAKVFLLALAIVDDIGAIAVIAVFYRSHGKAVYLFGALGTIMAMLLLRKASVGRLSPFAIGAFVLWALFREAGIHPTLAGVILAFLVPTKRSEDAEPATVAISDHMTTPDSNALSAAITGISTTTWLERKLHGLSSFVVVPLFAVANVGIQVSTSGLHEATNSRLFWGSFLGLIVGKPVGIVLFTGVIVRLGWGRLPEKTSWNALFTVALVAGIGFTVSLLVTEIAFSPTTAFPAKLGVLLASLLAAGAGVANAFLGSRRSTRDSNEDSSEDAGEDSSEDSTVDDATVSSVEF